jgi:hypothetical protein
MTRCLSNSLLFSRKPRSSDMPKRITEKAAPEMLKDWQLSNDGSQKECQFTARADSSLLRPRN